MLLFGVFCCSLSVLFIKGSETDPVMLSAYRLLLGGILLAPLAWRAKRRHAEFRYGTVWKSVSLAAFFLSLHFISWIIGARLTPAANATLLVNMTPVVMPFVLYFLVREVLTPREWLGTGVAIAGMLALGAADFRFSPQYALGDAICFFSMLLYAVYLGFGSRNRGIPSIYLYVVPVYLVGGVFCLLAGIVLRPLGLVGNWIGPDLWTELWLILALAVIPTIAGHSIINWAFKHLRGQVVSILNLAQFIFAGLTSYLLFREMPTPAFYPAAILAVAGAVIVVRSRAKALR